MKISNVLNNYVHWLLRFGLVSVLLYHGLLKFGNLQGFADMLHISYTEVVLVALAEVGGSIFLLVGGLSAGHLFSILTRVGALLNIPVLIGAIAIIHWGRWNFVPSETHPMGGMEFQAVLILVMLYFLITGNCDVEAANSGRNSIA